MANIGARVYEILRESYAGLAGRRLPAGKMPLAARQSQGLQKA
jgi:hypothetical protein